MSIANLNTKVIYIHVPKTAGTSMEHASFIGGGGHQTIEYFRRAFELSFIGLDYKSMFKFGFVRNPYTRFASAVSAHYMCDGKQRETDMKYSINSKGMSKFIKENKERIKKLEWPEMVHLIPQYKFLYYTGKPARGLGWKGSDVDFIGKFENIKKDWKEVCKRAKVPYEELSTWRINNFQDYDSLYTSRTRKEVYNLYRKDFELFGYER